MTTIEAAEIGRVGGVIGKIQDRNQGSKKQRPFPKIDDDPDDNDESSPDSDSSSNTRPASSTQNRNTHGPSDDDEHRIDVTVSGIILPTLQILPIETRRRTLH